MAHFSHTHPGNLNFEVATWKRLGRQLLRDFAGKIVPGVYILFSITSMYFKQRGTHAYAQLFMIVARLDLRDAALDRCFGEWRSM